MVTRGAHNAESCRSKTCAAEFPKKEVRPVIWLLAHWQISWTRCYVSLFPLLKKTGPPTGCEPANEVLKASLSCLTAGMVLVEKGCEVTGRWAKAGYMVELSMGAGVHRALPKLPRKQEKTKEGDAEHQHHAG